MEFNRKTNRIIGGICEYCGIPASSCPHYQEAPMPVDEKVRLSLNDNAPSFPKISVEPLREEEKAKSLAEAQAKTKEFKKKVAKAEKPVAVTHNLVEPENTEL